MAKEIKLPKLSEDADEGTVSEVMIKEGDTIEENDSVIAVESDKATVEVPAEEAGTVKEVKVSEGDSIKTGDVIALLEAEEESNGEGDEQKGEQEEDSDGKSEKGDGQNEKSEEQEAEKEEKSEKKEESEEQEVEEVGDEASEKDEETGGEQEGDAETEQSDAQEESDESEEKSEEPGEEASASNKTPAAPGAKRLAREHDVNLEKIEGSGPDGLITKTDIEKAAGLSTEEKNVSNVELPDFSKWGSIERQPLSQIRKATAKQTQTSWQTIPHVTQFDEANVSGIEDYIQDHKDEVEEQGGKLTITAVLTKVLANALHQFPKFNASIDTDAGEVILKKYVHIGIAVDTEEGLLVPVIRDVDEKSIVKLAAEITVLAEKARNGELSTDELEGGNFIISNLGGIGGTQFTPVIFHPQVSILGVSEMATKPVYEEESENFQPVLTLPLSLSYDHRLIDGAEGARFLRYVCNALEDPYKALLGE